MNTNECFGSKLIFHMSLAQFVAQQAESRAANLGVMDSNPVRCWDLVHSSLYLSNSQKCVLKHGVTTLPIFIEKLKAKRRNWGQTKLTSYTISKKAYQ